MIPRRTFIAASLAAALPARAQTWPSKPIKLVVPYAPGGTTDVIARMVAEYLGQRLGHNIVVDNKPGKGAMVGTSGKAGLRSSPLTARARTLPALICGAADGSESNIDGTVPLIVSIMAGPAPR